MHQAKVTIIMPAYNAQEFIEASVRSILSQTYRNIELVVVNDGSKDDTENILLRIAREDIRLRPLSTENGGPAVARNRGLEIVSPDTEYIMFVDADDVLLPDAVEYALNGAQSGADLVIFGFSIIRADGGESHYFEPEQLIPRGELGSAFTRLYKANLLNQVWGKLYKSQLLLENNIRFKDYRWGEDRLFIFDCIEKLESICVLPECKYHYVMHEGESLITKFYDKKLQVCLESDEQVEKLCKDLCVEDDNDCRYMFAKSIFSCLTNLFSPSCKLTQQEKLDYIRSIVANTQVQQRCSGISAGLPTRVLCGVIKTGSAGLNLLTFKALAFVGKAAPALFIKLKHKK